MRLLPVPLPPLLISTFVLVMAACGAPDEESRTPGTSPATQPASESESVAVLPANFPRDFPMPAELHISEARFTEGDTWTQPNFLVRGTSPLSVSELAAFYNERLPAAGYELIQSADPAPGATSTLVYFESEDMRDCSVQLNGAGEGTDVLVSLPLRD